MVEGSFWNVSIEVGLEKELIEYPPNAGNCL